ncbi:MAG: hypothetical protein ACE14L_16240 [Terriglobales bacterium]
MVGTGRRPAEVDLEKAEKGNAVFAIGAGLLLAALLVAFFAPASAKVQSASLFIAIIAVLAVAGIGLMGWGWRQRRRSS